MRQCIERAFGLLTRRFGIFWRPLNCDYARWHVIIRVCAKLHNLCVDFNVGGSTNNVTTCCEDYAQGDNFAAYENLFNPENEGEFPSNSDQTSQKRMLLTLRLKEQGYTRPLHAASNSKEL
jgi:hypothetical protein